MNVAESVLRRPDAFLPYFLTLGLFTPTTKKLSPNYDPFYDVTPLERTGPFKTLYYWKQLDFEYTSQEDRDAAIIYNDFIPRHNLPLGN